MKTLTVRLPEPLVAQIEAESRRRRISKSDVVRERLNAAASPDVPPSYAAIADLAGCIDGLPDDLSDTKRQLAKLGYGRNRSR